MAADLDRQAIVARFSDPQLIQELVRLFRESSTAWLAELREALARQDAAEVRRLAHTLKGSASNFLAKDATAAALRVETLARAGDLGPVPEALTALDEEVRSLQEALAELVRAVCP